MHAHAHALFTVVSLNGSRPALGLADAAYAVQREADATRSHARVWLTFGSRTTRIHTAAPEAPEATGSPEGEVVG